MQLNKATSHIFFLYNTVLSNISLKYHITKIRQIIFEITVTLETEIIIRESTANWLKTN